MSEEVVADYYLIHSSVSLLGLPQGLKKQGYASVCETTVILGTFKSAAVHKYASHHKKTGLRILG